MRLPFHSGHRDALVLSAFAGLLVLAACDASERFNSPMASSAAFPMSETRVAAHPRPTQPLFKDPITTTHAVLPVAKADVHEPLPPAVPLPAATLAQADSGVGETNTTDRGGVNPAAGQAAAITDGQGEGAKYQLGAPAK